MLPFTGLRAGNTYSFVFEAVNRGNHSPCIGIQITDVFLRTDQQIDLSGELLLAVLICQSYKYK